MFFMTKKNALKIVRTAAQLVVAHDNATEKQREAFLDNRSLFELEILDEALAARKRLEDSLKANSGP